MPEYDPSLIKEECVVCGEFIGIEAKRYEQQGNYCDTCVRKCNQRVYKYLADKAKLGRTDYHLEDYEDILDKFFPHEVR